MTAAEFRHLMDAHLPRGEDGVRLLCDRMGVHRATVYRWRQHGPPRHSDGTIRAVLAQA